MAVQTTIKIRRDTAANWTSVNPTLASGEQGYETDTGKSKIGNGTSAWTALAYTKALVAADSSISLTTSTDSSSTSTGSIITAGGIGIAKNLYVGGNVNITGDLTFGGTATVINSTNLSVQDSLIYLSDAQFTVDSVDIGIYGAYGAVGHNTSGDHYHTGLIRKAGGGWHLFSAGSEPVSNVVSLTGVSYDSLKVGSLDVADASTTRTNLGLAIGTNVQAYNATLTGIATLGSGTGLLKNTAGTWSYDTNTYLTSASTLDASKLSGTIPSTVLGNSTHYIGTTAIALNRTTASQTLTGVSIDGNAATATTLATPRAINGTNFDGSAAITVKASTTNALGLTSGGNLSFSTGTTWDGGTSGITIGLSATPTSITSINGVTMPTTGSFVTSATTSLPNVTSVNSTTIPSSATLLTSTSTSSALTSVGTLTSLAVTGNVVYHVATNAQTTSYTLALTDDGKIVEVSNASANTVTIPLNSVVAFPVGTQITILQTGAGQTSLAVSAGVTLNCTPQSATNAAKLRAQWSSVTLVKRATDTWVAMGDLTA